MFHNAEHTKKLSLQCGCPVDTSAVGRSTDRAGRRDRRKARGNPFSTPPSSLRAPKGAWQSVSPLLVIARGFSPVAIRSLAPFVIASTERCAAIRFSFKRELRILSRFALRMTSRLVIATTIKFAINCRPVIAVRVSGGHHCEAEAPTEATGETAVRRAAIRFSS